MKNELIMKDVSISFDGKKALDQLSFEVYENEIFGFLGPSGAGKTTTIKLLTKQLKADSGMIELFGEEIDHVSQDTFEKIGILSDNSGAYERFSLYDNIKFFADIRRVDHARIDELLKRVGLYEDRNKKMKSLSRGMTQRALIVQAVLHKPKLLFLDEPTAALDPSTTKEIHQMLLELNREGTTIFLTTHRMEEADQLCDRIAFLNKGHVIESGSPEELKVKYAKDKMVAVFKENGKVELDKSSEALLKLAELSKNDELITLHTIEPTIEDIFLELTKEAA
mgnify:CR=1 FL=1